jgi:hypothetical protein
MSEGPINFGKPLLYLVILGCAGAGFYAWKNWPSHYEGNGWDIDFPNKWEASISTDPATPGKVIANGPLKDETHGPGVGWVTVNYHGALDFRAFVAERVNTTLENVNADEEIGHKKAMIFEYEEPDNGFRFLGSAVQRGDAVVIAAIGCKKTFFEDNKLRFEKVVRSVRCQR